jgi:hypothetical protein
MIVPSRSVILSEVWRAHASQTQSKNLLSQLVILSAAKDLLLL